jgi:hypothetical protein
MTAAGDTLMKQDKPKCNFRQVVRSGKCVLLAAHGNSLRALVKYLDGVSDADIVKRNIPTGIPLVYELDEDLKPIRHYYLGDAERAQKGMPSRGGVPMNEIPQSEKQHPGGCEPRQ